MIILHPTDVRQYLYCPRIIYFNYVQPVRKQTTLKMMAGTDIHRQEAIAERYGRRSRRQLPEGTSQHNVYLRSETLGLTGRLDRLIRCPDGRLVPIELKPSPKLETRHQYQLVAYAMMIEEIYEQPVEEAFIYSLVTRQVLPVSITQKKRDYVLDCLGSMRRMIEHESFPHATKGKHAGKCRDCEYRRYCGGI